MKSLKKLTLSILALLSTLAIAGGCNLMGSNSTEDSSTTSNSIESNAPTSDSESESNSESNSDETPDDGGETPDDGGETPDDGGETPDDGGETPDDGGETPDDGGETPDDSTHNELCDFSEWTLTTDVSCKADGEMTRYCLEDESHTETQVIPRRPHDFGNNGLCECGSSPTLPKLSNTGSTAPTEVIDTFISEEVGSKKVFEVSVDQPYTATINNDGEFWFQFSVPEAGQYAIVSHSNPNGMTIERYITSGHYVTPTPIPGRLMDDGKFISTISFEKTHFNDNWLSIGCIRGTALGQRVIFSIVRVEDASWKPSNIYENVYAKQIDGVKAPEGTQGAKAIEVPYETTGIYLDETTGWYHMPSGEIIYVAITKKAERQFGGGTTAFTDLIAIGSAMNFRINTATLPTGDYLIYDYAPMIMTDPTLDGVTANENSYEAQVNSDGLYPLTQELYDFLVAHAQKSPPATAPEEGFEANAWMSTCYYYKVLTPGAEENPIEITTLGSFTATRYNSRQPVYYKFAYTPTAGNDLFAAYEINVITDGVTLLMNADPNQAYQNINGVFGITNIVFEVDPVFGVILMFTTSSTSTMNIEVSITAVAGSSETPLNATLGDQTLQPIAAIDPEGEITYEACYAYTATENGTLTLTSDNIDAILQLGASTLDQNTVSVEVTAGETIILYVKNADGSNVDVNLSFTAA